MKQTDALVLDKIAEQVLSADILEEMISRTLAAAANTEAEHLERAQRELRTVEVQINRFVEAIGRGGDVPELASALKKAQTRRAELNQTIAALERHRTQLKRGCARTLNDGSMSGAT
jgi:hypothetical protein